MGSSKEEEEEAEPFIISTPKLLPLLSIQLAGSSIGRNDYEYSSEEHESGMLTPPLHTSASVPFRWEEEPGKPRPCTALTTTTSNNNSSISEGGLELPPRLKLLVTAAPSSNDQKMTKMSSPTTVLDGPYHNLPLFQSSSLRFTTRRKPREQRQGSFGSSTCGSPERGQFGNSSVVQLMSKKSLLMDEQRKGWRSPGGGGGFFGSWQRKSSSHHQAHKRGKSIDVGGDSFVFSSSPVEIAGFGGGDDDVESGGATTVKKVSRIRRKGSFSSVSQVRSHFWATIYKGFKQVLPLKKKSTSSKKDGLPV
ncbi:hypothetical protein Vadar_022227 [Vaccinium darrowii]|uniref:Uncharacterized protein n=1 Tax=Vaccinium darrowii TaxID=229202 RepID=A0ACB7ZEF6_9ERIC|nr:hypothetical protein Vadar_022227 [Vaccinium darrowii]